MNKKIWKQRMGTKNTIVSYWVHNLMYLIVFNLKVLELLHQNILIEKCLITEFDSLY